LAMARHELKAFEKGLDFSWFVRGCGHFINGLRCRLKLSRYEEYTPQGNEENSETIFKFHNVAWDNFSHNPSGLACFLSLRRYELLI
jgi:hypothetical protein